ncbi:DUF6169 family protein [Mucilaginibacter pedocola]|uniref:Uncharacterized protein n=1 Tax=Mucilaginibacter pedocola TaxID=1792845 RepID=A0A1S9P9D2_9SPHI|nr:DUF6169 family protein [Mucilaginibacter pedocola]OOQ57437.1 hypothetical protein BC343_15180 [Mucilaginibacter pedocola]
MISYQLGEINAFSLSLYPDTEPSHVDHWIKNTVIKVIGDILEKDSNVIFYICDSEDNRHDKRHLVFEYWYQKSAEVYAYVSKFNYAAVSENGYPINASVLYNNQNPLGDLIIESFKSELDNF